MAEDFYDRVESEVEGLMQILRRMEDIEGVDEAEELIGSAVKKILKLVPTRIRDVRCPQCKKDFVLTFDQSLIVYNCPSGGVYSAEIKCPHCNYREEL